MAIPIPWTEVFTSNQTSSYRADPDEQYGYTGAGVGVGVGAGGYGYAEWPGRGGGFGYGGSEYVLEEEEEDTTGEVDKGGDDGEGDSFLDCLPDYVKVSALFCFVLYRMSYVS